MSQAGWMAVTVAWFALSIGVNIGLMIRNTTKIWKLKFDPMDIVLGFGAGIGFGVAIPIFVALMWDFVRTLASGGA